MNPYIQSIQHVHEAARSNKIKRSEEDVILRSILGSAPSVDMGSLIGTLVQTYGTQDQGKRIASILIGESAVKKTPSTPPRTPQRRGRPPNSPPPLRRKRQVRSASSDDSPPPSPPPKKRKDYWNQKDRNTLITLVNNSIEKYNEIRWKGILSEFSPRRTEQAVRNKYLALIKENVIAPLMEEDNRQTEDRSGVSDTTQTLPENTDRNTTTPGARG